MHLIATLKLSHITILIDDNNKICDLLQMITIKFYIFQFSIQVFPNFTITFINNQNYIAA